MRRSSTIDLLRGVSILLVLIHHFHLTYRFESDFLKHLARNGNYGVTIFFVISGYLITSTTLARAGALKDVSLQTFYRFRFARIIPNLLLMLTIVSVLAASGIKIFQSDAGTAPYWLTIASILTFTHNVLMQKYGWFNYCLNTLWSLSVEEVFYFTFPLLCLLLRKERFIIAGWAVFALVAPFYRAHYSQNDIIAMHGNLACFDGIAIGCIVALLTRKLPLPTQNMRQIISAIAAAGIAFIYWYKGIFANVVAGISFVALSTGLILFMRPQLHRAPKAILWLGKNSYELYLFHIVILAILRTLIPRADMTNPLKPFWFALFIALSAAAAEIISRYYSEPLNRQLRSGASLKKSILRQLQPID